MKFQQSALTILLCAAGSVLVGLSVFGGRIFDRQTVLFQFIGSGLCSGIYVAMFRHHGRRTGMASAAVVYLLVVALAGSATPARLFRDAVLAAGLLAAVRVGLASSRRYPRVILGKFVLWSAVFAAVHLAAFMGLSVFNSAAMSPKAMLMPTQLGALIGAGVGLGFEVSELIGKRLGPAGSSTRAVGA